MPTKQNKTIRQTLISFLKKKKMNARELSQNTGISEKDVFEHLTHVERSLKKSSQKFIFEPYQCQICSFTFDKRKKLSKPGRCPKCKQGSIEPARFKIL